MSEENQNPLVNQIVEQLKTCFDPEIPVNIYDLGLIYKIDIENETEAKIEMTLTSPNCPAVETLPEEVVEKVEEIDGITKCHLELVWEPPFTQEMMSDEAKLTLGLL